MVYSDSFLRERATVPILIFTEKNPGCVPCTAFFFFVQMLLGLDNKLVGLYVFEMKFFTLSVEAQAPMVEPELTEVGELHSLTDWQVSEASEEAELDEFCSIKQHRNAGKEYTSHQKRKKNNTTNKKNDKKHIHRDTHRREGRMREQRVRVLKIN